MSQDIGDTRPPFKRLIEAGWIERQLANELAVCSDSPAYVGEAIALPHEGSRHRTAAFKAAVSWPDKR
jgi:hypothetical protein